MKMIEIMKYLYMWTDAWNVTFPVKYVTFCVRIQMLQQMQKKKKIFSENATWMMKHLIAVHCRSEIFHDNDEPPTQPFDILMLVQFVYCNLERKLPSALSEFSI